jgi:two-component system, sensor histidine kinase PdtaS
MYQYKTGFLCLALFFALLSCGRQAKKATESKNTTTNLSERKQADTLLRQALNYVHRQGNTASDMDSALLLTHKAEAINQTLKDKFIETKVYFVFSNALREKGDTAQGHAYCDKSVALLKTLDAPADLGEAYLELSNYAKFVNLEDVPHKKSFYELALPLFKQAGLKQRQADVLKELADFNQLQNNFGLAMIQLSDALNLYSATGHKELQGLYDLLSVVCTAMGDYPTAVKYGLMAVRTAEQVNDTSMQLCTKSA